MKKSKLTEEELALIKEELKKELKAEMMEEARKKENKEKSILPKKSKVSNATYQKDEVQNNNFKIPDRKKTFFEPELIEKNKAGETNENMEMEKTSPILIVSIVALLIVGIIFVPKVYEKYGKRVKQDKITDPAPVEPIKAEVKYNWNDEIIKEIYNPIMRENKYQDSSYYMNDKITLNDFNNNFILYNTLVDLYEDYISDYEGGYSGSVCNNGLYVSVEENVLKTHLKNIFTTSLSVENTDFYVPSYIESNYPGLWKYHANINQFVYYGDCNPNPVGDTTHYDILVPDTIETLENGKIAKLTYYIGFVKVRNNNYEIYSDANYENQVSSGTLSGYPGELDDLVKTNKSSFKKYMYTYSTENCPYKALCYVSGEYIDR